MAGLLQIGKNGHQNCEPLKLHSLCGDLALNSHSGGGLEQTASKAGILVKNIAPPINYIFEHYLLLGSNRHRLGTTTPGSPAYRPEYTRNTDLAHDAL